METIITKNDLTSAIAYWGIKQSPYAFPKNMEAALVALEKRIDEKNIFKSPDKKVIDSYKTIGNKELKSLIDDLIKNTPEVAIWNVTQVEQNNGITDPKDEKRTVKFAATSRFGPMQPEDNDFIDLDALSMNVYGMVSDEEKSVCVDTLQK